MVDLRQLRAFVAIAEELSFTRAAGRLGVAQSPLSQQIRKAEDDLGVQLLVRTTRSVSLTAAGEVLLERLRPSLGAIEQALDAAARTGRGARGQLSVGLTASATYRYLPGILNQFELECPGISLDLHTEMFTPAQAEQLRTGMLSAAILRPPIREDGLHVEVLGSESLTAVLPPGHKLADSAAIAWTDLRDQEFVSYPLAPVSTIQTRITNACIEAGFVPIARHFVSNSAAMMSMVGAGGGIAIVPDSMRALKFSGVEFRALIKPRVSIELALAYREGTTDPATLAFAEIVRTVVGDMPLA